MPREYQSGKYSWIKKNKLKLKNRQPEPVIRIKNPEPPSDDEMPVKVFSDVKFLNIHECPKRCQEVCPHLAFPEEILAVCPVSDSSANWIVASPTTLALIDIELTQDSVIQELSEEDKSRLEGSITVIQDIGSGFYICLNPYQILLLNYSHENGTFGIVWEKRIPSQFLVNHDFISYAHIRDELFLITED